ncbi:MAG TPA: VOC family protein [Vicinamibacterales bacterium]|nr:VOC family protein [Vicinamibacterales bacterium]
MIKNAIASLAVSDVSKAAVWYERLFGRPADAAPMKELVEWKFKAGGWLQVYQAPDRAGNGSCTLSVTDLADEVSRLQQAGFETSEPAQTATVRVMMIRDPDGNSIALAEMSSSAIAQ